MPHDVHGKEIKVGDRVHIPCVVKALHLAEEYCNIDVEFCYPMPPYNERPKYSNLNTKQVERVEHAALEDLLCPVHHSLDERGELRPFDNCLACIRNERDELREALAALHAGEA